LLLVDGGRGQLGAVLREFEKHGLHRKFCIAAIAKARTEAGHSDRRAGNTEDRIFVPGRGNPLNIKAGSPEMLFLQHVRNTVHDFVLGRHRKARTNQALRGELRRIPGFGPRLTRALWEQFDSLPAMAAASDEELRRVAGMGTRRIQALREQLKLVLN
jgi:excinuclease ABC subunit C